MKMLRNILYTLLFLMIGISAYANDAERADTTKVGVIIQEKGKAAPNSVYEVVEEMPSYPGGMPGLMNYLSTNVHYPAVAEENGIQGRVICTFVVERDGTITDVRVAKSVNPALDKEAVRVICSMQNWNPGYQKGKPVRVRYTLPITFSLKKKSVHNSLIGQLLSFSKGLITNKLEPSTNKGYERNYYNYDCIDYILIRGTDKIYTLREGKNTLYTITKENYMRDDSKVSATRLRCYPGSFVNEKKLDKAPYSLPVKKDKTVSCYSKNSYYGKDSVEIAGFYFRMNPGDTIYASRAGVACPDVVNDRLFVYHDDGTIALYTNIHKLVKHEDKIKEGQPIGTLWEGKKETRFYVLYLTTSSIKVTTGNQFPYRGFSPRFKTAKGEVHINGNVQLTAP